MRRYEWQPFKIPGTPCILYGREYNKMKELQGNLMDRYPEYEFRLNAIDKSLWQMEYSI